MDDAIVIGSDIRWVLFWVVAVISQLRSVESTKLPSLKKNQLNVSHEPRRHTKHTSEVERIQDSAYLFKTRD